MKTARALVLMLVACVVVWGAIVGVYVHTHPIPTAEREPVLMTLIIAVPALFVFAAAIIGFRNADTRRGGVRVLVGALWATGFSAACWLVFVYGIFPLYFYAGGGE